MLDTTCRSLRTRAAEGECRLCIIEGLSLQALWVGTSIGNTLCCVGREMIAK